MTASRPRRAASLTAHARAVGEGSFARGLPRVLTLAMFVAGVGLLPASAVAQTGITWAASYTGAVASKASSSTAPRSRASAVPTAAPTAAPSRAVRHVIVETSSASTASGPTRASRRDALPAVAEAQVARWATAYSTTYRASFVRAIERGQPYGEMIATKLRNAGLPGALIYLPVVESRFSARATSRAGAVGLWQFMAGTARGYGLRVDTWVDERRDPYRATDAAVRYLRELHDTFGDWYLALAAYNSGDGRVSRAVRSSGSTGTAHAFWTAQGSLPRETREYVPQLLGVARVGADPAGYGIDLPHEPPHRDLVRVVLPPASRLTALADVWGMSLTDLAQLNPALNWAATPPDGNYALVVPAADAAAKRDRFLALPRAVRRLSDSEIARILQR